MSRDKLSQVVGIVLDMVDKAVTSAFVVTWQVLRTGPEDLE